MIDQKKIDRINALAHKSKTPEGLTEAEKAEQQALRQEYVQAVRASLRGQLEHTTVLRPDGSTQKLSDLHKRNKKQ